MLRKIEVLFEKASQLYYDDLCGMVKVEKMMGPGFSPGCYGTHNVESNVTKKHVMVLGQDFDTEINHKKLTENGEVESNTTWRNLKILLKDIKIDEEVCFFYKRLHGTSKRRDKKYW